MNRIFVLGTIAISWYLLAPPFSGTEGVNTTASLTGWSKVGQYASESECSQARNSLVYATVPARNSSVTPQMVLATQRSVCVSDDDFRLESAPSLQGSP